MGGESRHKVKRLELADSLSEPIRSPDTSHPYAGGYGIHAPKISSSYSSMSSLLCSETAHETHLTFNRASFSI